jgi:hypothetical protein
MKLDNTGWTEVANELTKQGWQGTLAELQRLIARENEATSIRLLEQSWSWGPRAKRMVFKLIACAKRRQGSVRITQGYENGHGGPAILLSLPAGSRLEAMQLQVHGSNHVYVVRRFNGDWRSCRDFRW